MTWNTTLETVPLTRTVPLFDAKLVDVMVFEVTSRSPDVELSVTPEVFSVYLAELFTTPPMRVDVATELVELDLRVRHLLTEVDHDVAADALDAVLAGKVLVETDHVQPQLTAVADGGEVDDITGALHLDLVGGGDLGSGAGRRCGAGVARTGPAVDVCGRGSRGRREGAHRQSGEQPPASAPRRMDFFFTVASSS
ncbi:hypothetical protein JM654_16365 [Microbacterium oxydans]|nr:hypothetical protein [Microbacterium oxydans]